MAASRLNLDVLMVVCRFLTDVSDLLAFSSTCSTLRPGAIRWMLQACCICLTSSNATVQQFHFFLFADLPARAPHVRALSIVRSQPPSNTAGRPKVDPVPLIVDVLTSCGNIETIDLFLDDSFTGYDSNLPIVSAIADMQNIRSLSVKGLPRNSLVLLREVRSPLRNLAIRFPPRANRSSFWSPHALAEFLPRFALTLEELEVASFIVDPDAIQTVQRIVTPSIFSTTQYSLVRSLSIGSFLGKPLLDHLQHLFPALDGTLSIHNIITLTSEDAYAHIRTTNQHAQGSDGNSSHSPAWMKLNRVICGPLTFYLLGLCCPVRLVRIDRCSSHALRYATDALRENPVPRLTLSLLLGGLLQGLDELFSAELAGTLTHLTLDLVYTHEGGKGKDPGAHTIATLPWSHFLAKIVSAFRPLQKLTHLCLVIQSSVYYPSYPAMMQSDEFACTVHESSFDFDGASDALTSSLPSLRYLFVETSGRLTLTNTGSGSSSQPQRRLEYWRATRGWRVTKHPANGVQDMGLASVELNDNVMETIIRNEELVLSDLEHVGVVSATL